MMGPNLASRWPKTVEIHQFHLPLTANKMLWVVWIGRGCFFVSGGWWIILYNVFLRKKLIFVRGWLMSHFMGQNVKHQFCQSTHTNGGQCSPSLDCTTSNIGQSDNQYIHLIPLGQG